MTGVILKRSLITWAMPRPIAPVPTMPIVSMLKLREVIVMLDSMVILE